MNTNIKDFDVSSLSEQELKKAAARINERLKEIDKEKQEKIRRKKAYALIQPKPKYVPNYVRFYNTVRETVSKGGAVNAENIDEICGKCQSEVTISKDQIYPCPQCEKIGVLHVGEFGDYDPYSGIGKSQKRVCCSCCDFVCNTKYQETDFDAWESFHEWLIRHGYLNPADPTASIQEMEDYGSEWADMLPLHKEAAEKCYQSGLQVFRLHSDSTETPVIAFEEIKEHAEKGKLLGIEKDEWKKRDSEGEE